MANAYVMSLTEIGLDANDNTALKTLTFEVTDGGSQVSDLETDFVVYNVTDSSVVSHTAASGAGNTWVVTFDTAINNSKMVRVQIDDTTASKKSDRILVDFNGAVSSGAITFSYVIPDEAGDYSMQLDIPNVSGFTSLTAPSNIDVRSTPPVSANSSIAYHDMKPYLTHFTGETITLMATIHDSNDTDADGNYEFSIIGDLQ